jgi:hypothetical protein
MIYLTLKQAQQIVDAFGGEEAIAAIEYGDGHSGNGLYLGWKDYQEEGSEFLGPEAA